MSKAKNKKNRVLHITPHLGGGVGRVLLNYLLKVKNDQQFAHEIICLDYANENAKNISKYNGSKISDNFSGNHSGLLNRISKVDIVLVHWWNHPLLYDFLVRKILPPCRLIIWSHISGLEPPNVFSKSILSYPDIFVFTSPISLESKEVVDFKNSRNKFKTVWSTGGLSHVKDVLPKEHKGFNVGYIGTVDFSKMYSGFIDLCAKIDIPDIKFVVCGGPEEKLLEKEAKEKGVGNKFIFTGKIENINDYLAIFDVFGYPLSSNHYGTCDQALAEAMASGIVPVVFDNKMEKYMIRDSYSGIVAKDEREYADAIIKIYKNKNLKNILSDNTKKEALKRFSLEQAVIDWENIFKEIMNINKSVKQWDGKYSGEKVRPYGVFLESIGEYGKIFEENNKQEIIKLISSSYGWKSKTKGSIKHYLSFFPNDGKLKNFVDITKNN